MDRERPDKGEVPATYAELEGALGLPSPQDREDALLARLALGACTVDDLRASRGLPPLGGEEGGRVLAPPVPSPTVYGVSPLAACAKWLDVAERIREAGVRP